MDRNKKIYIERNNKEPYLEPHSNLGKFGARARINIELVRRGAACRRGRITIAKPLTILPAGLGSTAVANVRLSSPDDHNGGGGGGDGLPISSSVLGRPRRVG